jgi:hypothetical protein
MGTAYENFVQAEFPKRVYTLGDTPQESVLVRRGGGARGHEGVSLLDGQVLGNVGGALVGVNTVKFGTFPRIGTVWTIAHGLNSEALIVQAFDENKLLVNPNSIQIVDANTVVVSFGTSVSGTANIVALS